MRSVWLWEPLSLRQKHHVGTIFGDRQPVLQLLARVLGLFYALSFCTGRELPVCEYLLELATDRVRTLKPRVAGQANELQADVRTFP